MMRTLVRDPIYRQLNAALRDLLGGFAPGEKFFSERQVCDRFDVSRATANKALSNLVVEGALEFRKGVGTFVAADAIGLDLRVLTSFTHKARALGRKPSTRVLSLVSMSAAEADGRAISPLAAGADESLYYIERLRLADATPVILERRYVRAGLCGRLTRRDLRGSLYEHWTERDKLQIAGAYEVIRAVNIRGDDAKRLEVTRGAAGLLVIATGHLESGEPLWCERTLYRGDAYTFRNRTGRIRSARPAIGTLMDPAAGDEESE